MKIVGLMVARDEELCCGMTIETVKDVINELVLVDNMSKDSTVTIVKDKCKKFDIKLHLSHAPLTKTINELRQECLLAGLKTNPDWFLNMDADTVFNSEKLNFKEMAINSKYEQIWFKTMNLYSGDIKHRKIGILNIPHLWMFKNIKNIYACGNYVCPEHTKDPNENQFLGWNLNGIKHKEHLFWRYQLWHSRRYNKEHNTNLSINEYIKKMFTIHFPYNGYPSSTYLNCFVLNRLRYLDMVVTESLESLPEQFVSSNMDYPKVLKEWDCPFELIFNEKDEIVGRKPDLVDVPILEDEDIWQISHKELKGDMWWK